jgi:hypothetical protein
MAIIMNWDVMLAKCKMRSRTWSELVGGNPLVT